MTRQSDRAHMVRHWIDCASLAVQEEPYGTMPTLHAHSQCVMHLLKALESTNERHYPSLRGDENLFAQLFDLLERFRDILSRLRLDPELSTHEACLTLTMIARLFQNIQSTHASKERSLNASMFDAMQDLEEHIDREAWIQYYLSPWQLLLRMGSAQVLARPEPSIQWQLARLYEACCVESLPVIHEDESATDLNANPLDPSTAGQRIVYENSDPLSIKERGELALQYAETLARTVRQSVSVQMEVPDELPALDLETAIESLVGRADAELGAQVFRDLVLSFTLPRGVVGLRHTLLLSRSTSTIATNKHGDLVGHAHGAALQGPSRVWQHGVLGAVPMLGEGAGEAPGERHAEFLHTAQRLHNEAEERERQRLNNQDCVAAAEMERGCVLLAGLAMIFAPSSTEARKGLAFQGRVRLPFFSVPLERKEAKSSVELMTDGSWCYFEPIGGKLVLKHRGSGLEALKVVCALLMLDASR